VQKWNLVVHQATQTSVSIWVGTLLSDLRKPEECVVEVLDYNKQRVHAQHISSEQWQRPFRQLNNRFFQLLLFTTLTPDTRYFIEFKRLAQVIGKQKLNEECLARGQFQTLPVHLSTQKNFVVALGSCFYSEADQGAAANAYSNLYCHGEKQYQPNIKLLTGDQVYLDIGLDSLSPLAKDIRNRIAEDYARSWHRLSKMLKNGATWFLADDHEYWNNFPHTAGSNPYLWMITAFNKVKAVWQKAAKDGVERIQQISKVRTFNLGSDLSFCLADCRSYRDKHQPPQKFMPNKDFKQVITWAKNLTSPGIIVLPQPLLVKAGCEHDYNLASHPQYQELVLALSASGHDIVCLSGDVHFGRIASVPIGNQGAKLYEVISSPMSNLTGLDGKVAAATALRLGKFPAVNIKGVTPQKVVYQKHWSVSAEWVKKWYLPNYKKTKEHFMTLGFKKAAHNTIELNVQAWKVRECYKSSGLPKPEFSSPICFTLK